MKWCDLTPGLPNNREMLLASLLVLVVKTRTTVADLKAWVADVRRMAPRFASGDAAGLPSEWKPSVALKISEVYAPLSRVFIETSSGAKVSSQSALQWQQWEGPEQQIGLTVQRLKNYKAKAQGPKRSARWKTPEMLFGVADLIHREQQQMLRLLDSDTPAAPPPTQMERRR